MNIPQMLAYIPYMDSLGMGIMDNYGPNPRNPLPIGSHCWKNVTSWRETVLWFHGSRSNSMPSVLWQTFGNQQKLSANHALFGLMMFDVFSSMSFLLSNLATSGSLITPFGLLNGSPGCPAPPPLSLATTMTQLSPRNDPGKKSSWMIHWLHCPLVSGKKQPFSYSV